MTKNELKSIIKECLLEILTDGLGESLNEVRQKKVQAQRLEEKKEFDKKMVQRKREVSDSISYITKDPVLQKVLSHTAATTLRDQSQNEIRVPTASSRLDESFSMDTSDPGPGINLDQIFKGVSKNWEIAAFSDKRRP